MRNTESTNQVINFLIRIAQDPNYKTRYEENPTKILDEAGIPKEKQTEIMSGDFQKVQGAVGITSVCYMLTHSDN
ncbi:MAG TPA: hypothetical protein VH415_06655 [Nitrososphaeraceae archaeon]|jgi:hypothetical protein